MPGDQAGRDIALANGHQRVQWHGIEADRAGERAGVGSERAGGQQRGATVEIDRPGTAERGSAGDGDRRGLAEHEHVRGLRQVAVRADGEKRCGDGNDAAGDQQHAGKGDETALHGVGSGVQRFGGWGQTSLTVSNQWRMAATSWAGTPPLAAARSSASRREAASRWQMCAWLTS